MPDVLSKARRPSNHKSTFDHGQRCLAIVWRITARASFGRSEEVKSRLGHLCYIQAVASEGFHFGPRWDLEWFILICHEDHEDPLRVPKVSKKGSCTNQFFQYSYVKRLVRPAWVDLPPVLQGDSDYAGMARRAVLAGLWQHVSPGLPRQRLGLLSFCYPIWSKKQMQDFHQFAV